jgi:hypothetical protein
MLPLAISAAAVCIAAFAQALCCAGNGLGLRGGHGGGVGARHLVPDQREFQLGLQGLLLLAALADQAHGARDQQHGRHAQDQEQGQHRQPHLGAQGKALLGHRGVSSAASSGSGMLGPVEPKPGC